MNIAWRGRRGEKAYRRALSRQNENREDAGIHDGCGADGPGIGSAAMGSGVTMGVEVNSDEGSRGGDKVSRRFSKATQTHDIRIVDLVNHQVTTLTGPAGLRLCSIVTLFETVRSP
jgi:hypothetical protein